VVSTCDLLEGLEENAFPNVSFRLPIADCLGPIGVAHVERIEQSLAACWISARAASRRIVAFCPSWTSAPAIDIAEVSTAIPIIGKPCGHLVGCRCICFVGLVCCEVHPISERRQT
jgi:hypothetical protein